MAFNNTNRILLLGDTHGNIAWTRKMIEKAQNLNCAKIVQVGDFGLSNRSPHPDPDPRFPVAVNEAAKEANIDFGFIDGNHDFHDGFRAPHPSDRSGIRRLGSNLVWFDRGAVWEWGGIKFGALGGSVSPDRNHRTPGDYYWAETETTKQEDVDALISRSKGHLDILITHDAPEIPWNLPKSIVITDPSVLTDATLNRQYVRIAMGTLRPSLLVHGHYHHRYSDQIGETKIEGIDCDKADDYRKAAMILELVEGTKDHSSYTIRDI